MWGQFGAESVRDSLADSSMNFEEVDTGVLMNGGIIGGVRDRVYRKVGGAAGRVAEGGGGGIARGWVEGGPKIRLGSVQVGVAPCGRKSMMVGWGGRKGRGAWERGGAGVRRRMRSYGDLRKGSGKWGRKVGGTNGGRPRWMCWATDDFALRDGGGANE